MKLKHWGPLPLASEFCQTPKASHAEHAGKERARRQPGGREHRGWPGLGLGPLWKVEAGQEPAVCLRNLSTQTVLNSLCTCYFLPLCMGFFSL